MQDRNFSEGHRQRLRQRYLRSGADGLLDYELLELILFYAIPRRDVKVIAKTLIQHFGSLRNVFNAPVSELCKISGIGESTAILISLIKPVCLRYQHETMKNSQIKLSNGEMLKYLFMLFDRQTHESCAVLLYDLPGKLISSKVMNGNAGSITLSVQDIVLYALGNKASIVVLSHNHPQGIMDFSDSDIRVTRNLAAALKLFNIELYDHILVSGNKSISLREEYGHHI